MFEEIFILTRLVVKGLAWAYTVLGLLWVGLNVFGVSPISDVSWMLFSWAVVYVLLLFMGVLALAGPTHDVIKHFGKYIGNFIVGFIVEGFVITLIFAIWLAFITLLLMIVYGIVFLAGYSLDVLILWAICLWVSLIAGEIYLKRTTPF